MAEFIPTGIGGFAAKQPTKQRKVTNDKPQANAYDRRELMPPPRPKRDYIPPEDVIESLVSRAVMALSKGIYWDRGSIINIVL